MIPLKRSVFWFGHSCTELLSSAAASPLDGYEILLATALILATLPTSTLILFNLSKAC